MDEKYQSMLIGTINLNHKTSSTKIIMEAVMELYQRIMNKQLLARRINITANNIVNEEMAKQERDYKQIDLFTSYQEEIEKEQEELTEKELQKAMIDIKRKYGKNAILKGMNLQEGGTTIDRNKQIGGHHE